MACIDRGLLCRLLVHVCASTPLSPPDRAVIMRTRCNLGLLVRRFDCTFAAAPGLAFDSDHFDWSLGLWVALCMA